MQCLLAVSSPSTQRACNETCALVKDAKSHQSFILTPSEETQRRTRIERLGSNDRGNSGRYLRGGNPANTQHTISIRSSTQDRSHSMLHRQCELSAAHGEQMPSVTCTCCFSEWIGANHHRHSVARFWCTRPSLVTTGCRAASERKQCRETKACWRNRVIDSPTSNGFS